MDELIFLNEEYYVLKRKIKEEQVNGDMNALKTWRDELKCDHVLKTNGYYLLVNYVTDAEIIEND
jgi:hypothetical protein